MGLTSSILVFSNLAMGVNYFGFVSISLSILFVDLAIGFFLLGDYLRFMGVDVLGGILYVVKRWILKSLFS
jgi:hypothetical protein